MSLKIYPSSYGPKVTVLCYPASTGETPKVMLAAAMEKLLIKLVKRKPEWTFTLGHTQTARVDTQGKVHCDKIVVHQDGEQLGRIHRTLQNRVGYVYGIDCPALNETRQRGSETRTANLDKAVNLITNTFRPKPDQERNKDIFFTVRNDIHRASSNALDVLHSMSNYKDIMHGWTLNNIDDLRERIIAETNITEVQLDKYVEARTHALAVRDLSINVQRYGVLVHSGSNYTWVDDRGGIMQSHTTDTLPDSVKSKIAKLKLMEVNDMLTGVGYRAGRDTYVIMEDPE